MVCGKTLGFPREEKDDCMEAVTSVFVAAFNGIKTMGITDLLDVIIVAYLIYKVIWFVRRTNSYNLAKGVVLILIALWLS